MKPYAIFLMSTFILLGLNFPAFCVDISDEDIEAEEIEGFPIDPFEALIAKFRLSGGSELGSSQLFIVMLCDALGVERPASHRSEVRDNAYTFEAQVTFTRGDGQISKGRIDLYKKGYFIWESKQGSPKTSKHERDSLGGWRQGTATRDTKSWDKAMIAAHSQAQEYAGGLSLTEGRPPFIIVADIGEVIEVYANFTGEGEYTPFPSARDYRILLDDLRKPEIQERLRLIWTDPMSLDPSRHREKVTREIAVQLAELAKSLEASGSDVKSVSDNLMCFTLLMFAEDVNLLPHGSFTRLMETLGSDPGSLNKAIKQLWSDIAKGGHSDTFERPLLRFAGPFENVRPLTLNQEQLSILHQAAKSNWAAVEPAIFGTLLEKALDPKLRHQLGAHYTPPSYVERLVYPTIIEPLRVDWNTTKKTP